MQYCQYVKEHFQAPTKEEKPWNMQGWLLLRVQEAEMAQWGKDSRWSYYFKMKSYIEPSFAHKSDLSFFVGDAGPIPQRDFNSFSDDAYHHLQKCVEAYSGRMFGWRNFSDFVAFLLFACGLSEHNPSTDEKNKQAVYEMLDPAVIVKWPYDYLGRMILEDRGKGAWNPNAFYPTPPEVVKAVCAMTFYDQGNEDKENKKDTRFATVNEPCCGTGAMLLEASNYSLYLSGQDIDNLLVMICKLNGVFFAPWLSFGFADINNESEETKQERSGLLRTYAVKEIVHFLIGSARERQAQAQAQVTNEQESDTANLQERAIEPQSQSESEIKAECEATHTTEAKNATETQRDTLEAEQLTLFSVPTANLSKKSKR